MWHMMGFCHSRVLTDKANTLVPLCSEEGRSRPSPQAQVFVACRRSQRAAAGVLSVPLGPSLSSEGCRAPAVPRAHGGVACA